MFITDVVSIYSTHSLCLYVFVVVQNPGLDYVFLSTNHVGVIDMMNMCRSDLYLLITIMGFSCLFK